MNIIQTHLIRSTQTFRERKGMVSDLVGVPQSTVRGIGMYCDHGRSSLHDIVAYRSSTFDDAKDLG